MKRRERRESLIVQEMTLDDIPGVAAIERLSLPGPWGERSFRHELLENPYASLFVVRRRGRAELHGFACVWIVDQEMKINSVAVHPGWRERGVGARLLRFILEFATAQGCAEATLEVRPSNGEAMRLYQAAGFSVIGRRRRYYTDTHEDALVMRLSLPSRGRG